MSRLSTVPYYDDGGDDDDDDDGGGGGGGGVVDINDYRHSQRVICFWHGFAVEENLSGVSGGCFPRACLLSFTAPPPCSNSRGSPQAE